MITVRTDFQTRAEEVNLYFRFLQGFDEHRLVVRDGTSAKVDMTSRDQTALFKTLKANGFLLLYNLVESTLRNAIEAIFDEFEDRGVSFDACLDKIRKIVLENVKKRNVDKMLPRLSSISVDIVAATFRKGEHFRGNVDGRRIRDVAESYGFEAPKRRSDKLKTVKDNRNDLAHGNKSFAEVGRDYDVHELETMLEQVVEYLKELLESVENYIKTQAYLSATPSARAGNLSS